MTHMQVTLGHPATVTLEMGNNQESSSESMNFASAAILWG